MQVAIRKMGNSQGVLIPKPFLVQVGFEDTADMQVKNGVIEIRPIKRNPREGWAKDCQRIALAGDDKLVWPEFANEGDAELVWRVRRSSRRVMYGWLRWTRLWVVKFKKLGPALSYPRLK